MLPYAWPCRALLSSTGEKKGNENKFFEHLCRMWASLGEPRETSPPSARVAAMSDVQQKTFKNRTTLKHRNKGFKLLLNTLTFSWNFLETSKGVYSSLDSYILPCSFYGKITLIS